MYLFAPYGAINTKCCKIVAINVCRITIKETKSVRIFFKAQIKIIIDLGN